MQSSLSNDPCEKLHFNNAATVKIIENNKELFTVFFSFLILSDWKSVTFCIFLSLLCSIIRAVTRNSGRVVFERGEGARGRIQISDSVSLESVCQ